MSERKNKGKKRSRKSPTTEAAAEGAASATATKGRKQQRLFSEKAIPEIEEAAEDYAAARDERQGALAEEIKIRLMLEEHMRARKLTNYVSPEGDIEVEMKPETVKAKVKIKRGDEGTADETAEE